MTPRSHRRLIVAFFAYVAALLSIPSPARAEDIDIFIQNPLISTQRPNVLIMLDTSANWAATDQVAKDGSNMYQNVRSELAKTISSLTPDVYRVGLMIYAETGTGNDSTDGGVPRLGVRNLDSSNQSLMVKFFETIDANFDKSNNTSMGLAFYEAYLYYTGQPGFAGPGKVKRDYYKNNLPESGNQQNANPTLAQSNRLWELEKNIDHAFIEEGSKVYQSPISDACQKNFIIYIANGNVSDPNAANVEATNKLADPPVNGDTSTIDIQTDDANQGNISDEWTRFLANNDLLPDASNPKFPGKQNVITYTVEVNPQTDTQGRANTSLLKSMADQGKGEYFGVFTKTTGAQRTLSDALNQIFAQIIDRNSVFAASTLPVSSNVRGTFLNQVYMGVFRPDPDASPRWPGNLKQYNLSIDDKGVFLAGKDGNRIEAAFAEEGFVKPDAQSFWTIDQNPGGFWDPTYYPDTVSATNPTASDLPDGAFVEKGGSAQHLRMTYGTDVTTRSLYTCLSGFCSSGTALNSSANHAFVESNANITDAMLGITGPQAVTITRSGNTATAVTGAAHGFTDGQAVTISAANPSAYDGIYTVTVVNSTTFTFPITETPVTPATGTIVAAKAGAAIPIAALTRDTTTATVTTTIAHGFADGSNVVIANSGSTGYDGVRVITRDPVDPLKFTFPIVESPVSPATVAGTATVGTTTKNIKANPTVGVTRSGSTVTIETTNNHGFSATNVVTIAGVTPAEYNGTYTILTASGKLFTYNLVETDSTKIGPPNPATGVGMTASGAVTRNVNPITRSGTTATATTVTTPGSTTALDHGFLVGDSITISGAAQSEYNGTFTLLTASGSTFTYTVPVNPATPATATATGGGGVGKASLVNWVRGANVQSDDNPNTATPPTKAERVRGYLHGDVLHSRPAVVNYNRASQPVDRDIAVYYGANDGIVHAVKGGQTDADGGELWGFLPSEFFNRFSRLYSENPKISSTATRTYFADGPVSVNAVNVKDVNGVPRLEGAGALAQIFIGVRRGGRFYYSLDVTDPTSPVYKWKIDNSTGGFAELGQSWSDARVETLNLANCPATGLAGSCKVLIFGAGYDAPANDPATQGTATMGRGIFVVDANTGTLIWSASPDNVTPPAGAVHEQVSGMTFAIPASLAVIDSDGDVNAFADRIYAPDTGGNIWRVNIGDTDPNNWTVRQVAALSGSAASQKRRFLNAPDVVKFDDNWDSILIGSGDREHPYDTGVTDRFYMIKDAHALSDVSLPVVTDSSDSDVSSLCDLTANSIQADPTSAQATADKTCLATSRGWKIRMTQVPGEKVVTSATTLAGTTIFGTSTPPAATTPGQCSSGLGKAFVYAIDFKDATAKLDLDPATPGVERGAAAGLGLPANPAPFVTEIQGKLQEGVIIPPTVIQPSATPVGQRYRVFWNLSVDN